MENNLQEPILLKNSFVNNASEKIVLIRHGETLKNALKTKLDVNNINLLQFIDVPINDKGMQQTKNISKVINELNIESVYVSPLYRTLQTAFFLLQNHPQKNKIKVIVHPLLLESSYTKNSFISDFKKSKKEFNENSFIKFDWSIFDKYFPSLKSQWLYFLNWIDNQDILKYINTDKDPFKNLSDSDDFSLNKNEVKIAFEQFNKLLSENKIERLESLYGLYQRFEKFKKEIKEKHKETLNNKDKKILVITHSAILKIIQIKFDNNTNKKSNKLPDNIFLPKNCEIISINI